MMKNLLFGIALLGFAMSSNIFAADPVVDEAVYAKIKKEGTTEVFYTLTSNWLYSVTTNNYGGANLLAPSGFVRGMVAVGDSMYFIDRNGKQILIVDGNDGQLKTPIKLPDDMFTYVDQLGETKPSGTLNFNDIKMDNAGNILVGNGITSNRERFQIYKVDLETGDATLVIDEKDLLTNFPEAAIRFDAFGVYGDVTGDAVILAANASAMDFYKWVITDGVAGEAEPIELNLTAGTWLENLPNPGTAPQIFPLGDDLFYLDGNATYPTLIDFDGNIIDGFYNAPGKLVDETTSPGSSWTMNEGHNGIVEFELGGEYFMLMAATNTARAPFSSFRLFKFADAGKSFDGLTCLWTFPQAGMGAASNAYRTAVPSVVKHNEYEASLFLYTGENGYGKYTFKIDDWGSLQNADLASTIKISIEGKTITFSETVAAAQIYGISGQLVDEIANDNSVQVNASGVYIVKVTTESGQNVVKKVVIL